jgi:glucose/arabinose dehydrogenase
MNRLVFGLSLVVVTATSNYSAVAALTTETLTNVVSVPIFVTAAPGDTSRIFIVEQTGRIKIRKSDGSISTFLNLSTEIECCGEQGLLGMAFHPDYDSNGYFYVHYTVNGPTLGDISRIARYRVSANPDIADIDSLTVLMDIPHPFPNHNSGMLAFSPVDAYLYIGMGDGGSGGDPGNRAQTDSTLLGKMLRIDVDNPDTGLDYGIPASNLSGNEIWAVGLRNPWRFSFDRSTGDLYIGDVGQQLWEEINFQPSTSIGDENYGWRCREGQHDYNFTGDCAAKTFVEPFFEYSHASGRCAIVGGYVYRGNEIPGLIGKYFYADNCTGEIWSLRYDGFSVTDFASHIAELNPDSLRVTSFGEDADGELYLAVGEGSVFKIVSADNGCCVGITGNIDGDPNNLIDIGDLTGLIDYLYITNNPPDCLPEANIDGDIEGLVDIGDLTALIDYLYISNALPADCL